MAYWILVVSAKSSSTVVIEIMMERYRRKSRAFAEPLYYKEMTAGLQPVFFIYCLNSIFSYS
ncbi:MAG TPA: hypothetical protein DHW78_04745 [Ruminococcaceae bacterium]|nr:hypothetical protein [Oscillospiraceae bacterium]HCC03030.1 hypothetical protein [Oscillospiraceae bacterium]HCM23618.1 hypothetical protein [Oscillospiraceae bacterium]